MNSSTKVNTQINFVLNEKTFRASIYSSVVYMYDFWSMVQIWHELIFIFSNFSNSTRTRLDAVLFQPRLDARNVSLETRFEMRTCPDAIQITSAFRRVFIQKIFTWVTWSDFLYSVLFYNFQFLMWINSLFFYTAMRLSVACVWKCDRHRDLLFLFFLMSFLFSFFYYIPVDIIMAQ